MAETELELQWTVSFVPVLLGILREAINDNTKQPRMSHEVTILYKAAELNLPWSSIKKSEEK